MTDNFDQALTELQRLGVTQLRRRYTEMFGESIGTGNNPWLVKHLAWRLQALAEGDLSERARQRAAELANDADLRLSPPRARPQGKPSRPAGHQPTPNAAREVSPFCPDERLPLPGALLTRLYKGQTHEVKVLEQGFALSAVAKKITGTHCNGFCFFRLGRHSQGASS